MDKSPNCNSTSLDTDRLTSGSQASSPRNKNSWRCNYVIILTHVTLFVQLGVLITSLNPATPALERFFAKVCMERYGIAAPPSTIDILTVLTLSMVLVGALFGSFFTGIFAAKVSRRGTMISYHVITLVSIVVMSPVAFYFRSYEAIIVGRCLNGFARGFAMNIITLYVEELSCKDTVEFFQSPPGYLVALGFVLGSVAGHPEVLGSDTLWPVLVACPAVLSVFYLLQVWIIPNTPAYHLQRNDHKRAFQSLRLLRSSDTAALDAEFKEIEMRVTPQRMEKVGWSELFTNSDYRKQLAIACTLFANIQTIGYINVMLYSDKIFIEAGVPKEHATIATIAVCAETVIIAFMGSLILKKMDKRRLLVSGNSVIIVSSIVLTASNALKQSIPSIYLVNILATCVFMFGVGMGPFLVSFPLVSESANKHKEAKAPILIFGGTIFWVLGAVVGLSAPYLQKHLGSYAWLVYAFITTLTTIFFAVNLQKN